MLTPRLCSVPSSPVDEKEYRQTRLLLLELISWGVAPEFFVAPLGLSREAILLYFRDLRIRLPANLPKGAARNRKTGTAVQAAGAGEPIKEEGEAEEEEGELFEEGEVPDDKLPAGDPTAPPAEPTGPPPPGPPPDDGAVLLWRLCDGARLLTLVPCPRAVRSIPPCLPLTAGGLLQANPSPSLLSRLSPSHPCECPPSPSPQLTLFAGTA